MTNEIKRAETARAHDDHELIDQIEPAPRHGGSSGGNLKRDIASRAEEEDLLKGDEGITRVHGADKPRGGDRPNLPSRD